MVEVKRSGDLPLGSAYQEMLRLFVDMGMGVNEESWVERKELADGTTIMVRETLGRNPIAGYPLVDYLKANVYADGVEFTIVKGGLLELSISPLRVRIGDLFDDRGEYPSIILRAEFFSGDKQRAFLQSGNLLVNWLREMLTENRHTPPPILISG